MSRFRWIRVYLFSFSVLVLIFSGAAIGQPSPTRVPTLTVTKTASPTEFTTVGEKITYTYKVTSAYEASSGLTITDSPLDAQPVCDRAEIKANETAICTATYTITQADLNRGVVENKATIKVNYTYPSTYNGCCGCGKSTTYKTRTLSAEASASVKYKNRPDIAITPSATPTLPPAPVPASVLGGSVTYCDPTTKAVNLPLAADANADAVNAQLQSGALVIKLGGVSARNCSVPAGLRLIACAVDPNVAMTFPMQVEAMLNSTSVNSFIYDGAGCTVVPPENNNNNNNDNENPPAPPTCGGENMTPCP